MIEPKASAAYAITVRLQIVNTPGSFGKIAQMLGEQGASIDDVKLLSVDFHHKVREITIDCKSEEHSQKIIEMLGKLDHINVLYTQDDVFEMHRGGKLTVEPTVTLKTRSGLAQAYTPGVARICTHIAENPEDAFEYTVRGKTVAIVSDGTAVLGLGDIGARAALPVMEGKAMLFKQFGGIDGFPICLNTTDPEKIIEAVEAMSPSFGGINLEDISAPRCFEIEQELQRRLDIPVFHDDQHGTACVVVAGLMNALKVIGKDIGDLKVAISGLGAGGVAITKMLNNAGVGNIVPCDSRGIVHKNRDGLNSIKLEILEFANKDNETGDISDALKGADLFVGVSKPGVITADMIKSMNKDPIVFALANPIPEIMPAEVAGIARIMATGRSDFANQVNNVLCFPGIFKGAFECRAKSITENMKLAAAHAIADAISDDEVHEEYIIPDPFNPDIPELVAARVREAAIADGVATIN